MRYPGAALCLDVCEQPGQKGAFQREVIATSYSCGGSNYVISYSARVFFLRQERRRSVKAGCRPEGVYLRYLCGDREPHHQCVGWHSTWSGLAAPYAMATVCRPTVTHAHAVARAPLSTDACRAVTDTPAPPGPACEGRRAKEWRAARHECSASTFQGRSSVRTA
jgi:hypothetical protein